MTTPEDRSPQEEPSGGLETHPPVGVKDPSGEWGSRLGADGIRRHYRKPAPASSPTAGNALSPEAIRELRGQTIRLFTSYLHRRGIWLAGAEGVRFTELYETFLDQ